MQVKTSELTGAALDWAVAKCEWFTECGNWEGALMGAYSTEWNYAGPIIEREHIDLIWSFGHEVWTAQIYLQDEFVDLSGPTPLIAAMRCFVASKCGDTIDVPDSLING